MGTFSHHFFTKPRNMAMFSVGAGIASLVCMFNPPTGLFMGASAILLAILSRMYGGRFSGASIAGIILGIFGVLLSVILFLNFIIVIRIMDNPEALLSQISDPALAASLREMLAQYRTMLDSLK